MYIYYEGFEWHKAVNFAQGMSETVICADGGVVEPQPGDIVLVGVSSRFWRDNLAKKGMDTEEGTVTMSTDFYAERIS